MTSSNRITPPGGADEEPATAEHTGAELVNALRAPPTRVDLTPARMPTPTFEPPKYMERFDRNPCVCGGKPIVKGTRITVKLVLDLLASGLTVEEIVGEYPSLVEADVYAVIQFAVEGTLDVELDPTA
ncbi:MAG TPA: DUF433 domain-containing protein [Polyangiales bacterium]|nr:DUF433 domain-containing protein [Polyangiales bacterium]